MITIILIIFAGFLNACMDVLQFKFDISIFKFLKNKQYEKYLNKMLSSDYTMDNIIKEFDYLTEKNLLINAYYNNSLGSLLRKKDPLRFQLDYLAYIIDNLSSR